MSDSHALLRSYLRQRIGLGDTELYLDGRSAAELHGLLASSTLSSNPRSGSPTRQRIAPIAAASTQAADASTPVRLVELGSLDALRADALGCTRCGLSATRTTVVFGEGDPSAELVVVGEAPGADEDRSGRPFVGRAGKLLNGLLAAVGFPREDVYICNVLKCRPPGNRDPQPGEVETCSPFLLRQVEFVKPRVILACGSFAAQTLLQSKQPISRLRGEPHRFHDVPLIATYHPAALLRNSSWLRSAWEDLQLLRDVFDRSSAAPS